MQKEKVNICTIVKKLIICSHCNHSCCSADLNIIVPLICTHPVTNAEKIMTIAQNVLCNITRLSSDDNIIETLFELTDIIRVSTARVSLLSYT